uniref:Bestrophin homolog n=1 Tax=Octactis speculum TaxID=3111310 RepID=A0A7S2G1G2_9STRA
MSSTVMSQFFITRRWLWMTWRGTIIRSTIPREVIANMIFAILVTSFLHVPGLFYQERFALIARLKGINQVWLYASSLVTFTMSFFLNQTYAHWRNIYSLSRKIQGRLNDIGLCCGTSASRTADGEYTDEASELLALVSRYIRLFSILMYASVSTKFAPLATPQGLAEMQVFGALTEDERELLLQQGGGHNAVIGWIWSAVDAGLRDGRLGQDVGATGVDVAPIALQISFQSKLLELRATYASIRDALTGRMPMAYTQLVQILVDLLVITTPLSLLHSVGGAGAVIGTGVITFFYSSVFNLAKVFLDPYDNEHYIKDGSMSLNVFSLQQETNLGSDRWRKAGKKLPNAVWGSQEQRVEQRRRKRKKRAPLCAIPSAVTACDSTNTDCSVPVPSVTAVDSTSPDCSVSVPSTAVDSTSSVATVAPPR